MGAGTAALEKHYLQFATAVEELNERSLNMVNGADRLVKLASGGDNGDTIVRKTIQLLSDPLEYVHAAGGGVRDTIQVLKRISATVRRLLAVEQELATTMLPMDTIQVLFRIESARLAPDVQQMFQALMSDIDTMQRKVKQIFSANTTLLRSTVDELPRVISELCEMAESHQSAAARRMDIDQSLASLQEEIERGSDRNVQLTAAARAVASDISSIVVALQTHDIVSQRLAHVDTALDLIEKGLSDVGSVAPAELKHVLADLRGAAAIQLRQLDSTRQEIEASGSGCHNAVAKVDRTLRELGQDCLLLHEFEAMTAAVDGMIQTLLESMTEVRKMMVSWVDSARSAHMALEPIAADAQRLSGALDDIGSDMRRIALNTQIQAAHVGDGTGLEVLAANTESVAKQAMSISSKVAGILEEIRSGFSDAVALLSILESEGERHLSSLMGSVTAHEAHLHGMRDQTLQLVTETGNTLESVTAHAHRLAGEAAFSQAMNEAFNDLGSALTDLNNELERVCKIDNGCDVIAASADLEAMYTMTSERTVHAHALHRTAPAGFPQRSDDGGDVELF